MVGTPKRPVVLRFVLGRGLVKARKESENTSRFVAREVTIDYAEETWDEAKKNIGPHVAQDVRAELTNMARLFRRHIIGAPGTKSSPRGTLTTVAKGEGQPSVPLSSMLPPWAPRNAKYMDRKRKAVGIQWFDNTGWSRRPKPANAGLLKRSFAANGNNGNEIWEDMFGKISVRIVRNGNPTQSGGEIKISSGTHMKVQVASIYVMALGKLDLKMLSAFRTSNPGLNALVKAHDPDLALRLGNMGIGGRRPGQGIYRPTLEPFLDFFLTRAIPHAVSQRIQKGTLGSLFRRSS